MRSEDRLTDQQRRALESRGVSVALSAGAGCGKTFVLTERFMAELEPEGGEPRSRLGQLVAITFTERAAREMRDRIRTACRRRLDECPDSQTAYWLELLRDLDSARISTIHAFCASLLRAHAVEAGLDPRFRVLDGIQSQTLLLELTDDVLRDRLAEREEAAIALIARIGLAKLRTVVARLLALRQEIDWTTWRGETAAGLVQRWAEFWRRDTVPRVVHRIADSSAARTLIDLSMRCPPAHPVMRERCDFLVARLPSLAEPRPAAAPAEPGPTVSLADLDAIREAAKVQGGGTKKDWANEEAFERFKAAAASLRKAIDDAKKRLQFDAAAALPAAEASLNALALAADVNERYAARKRELGVLDFSDLLIEARRLLVGSEREGVRRRLASQIRLLLVDEFQDTDPLQVELVKSLCDDEHLRGKLFIVGDHKQSIYRFRGADPRVFRRLREEFPPEGRLPLSLNFRSQPAILDFVNALFADELGPDYEPLRPHRPQISPMPAVEFLWASEAAAEERKSEAAGRGAEAAVPPSSSALVADPRRIEADWIARRIRTMLDSGEKIVWDDAAAEAGRPATRAPRPGDFALLFRALTNVESYEEALRRHGIDYYLVGGRAFYAQQEIFDLLNLLRTLNSPADEVSLAGVLRSPMFGLHDETLFWLLRDREERAGGLLEGEIPEEIEGDQRRQAAFALATLGQLRALKDRLPVAELMQEALRRTGYDAMLLAEFLGERKLANLQKLVEQARSLDRTGIFTLSDFIAQLSEFVARQPDEPLAATHAESTDVVKLMSIHQSKGLEFPIVVVPDLARRRVMRGPAVAFTRELGPALNDRTATTGYDLLVAAENDEDREEHCRLLYVAATRAADYLILSAGVDEPGRVAGPWMETLARQFDLRTGNRRDEQAAARPIARVTDAPPPVGWKTVEGRHRRDLVQIVAKARQMAADGQGRRPRYLTPVEIDRDARRQYSFSRLSGRLHLRTTRDDGVFHAGDTEPPIDALGLGTLVHAMMQEVDFRRSNDLESLARRLAEQHLSRSERGREESLAAEMIGRFLASPRAAQLAAAKEVYRELEFLLAWPPDDAARQTGGRYLQGFIDCLYRGEDGRWRLIDFKTNRATAETLAATAAAYEMQMVVYAAAAEKILKSEPAELTLCFLRPGLEHRFAWDAAARRRAAALVDEAILSEGNS